MLLIPSQTTLVTRVTKQASNGNVLADMVEPWAQISTAGVPQPESTLPANADSCSNWLPLIDQYSWNVTVAMNVMNAESGCNPGENNTGDYHPTCMGSRGLFQIGCDSTDNYAGMYNPAANVAQAYALYARRGWEPWSSTTCRYKVVCY